jgi:antitoxin VapB
MYNIYFESVAMKTAKIFRNGQSQAVRLPKEFRFEEEFVYVKKMGNAVVLLPPKGSWEALIQSLDKFSEDFMSERVQPPDQRREDL